MAMHLRRFSQLNKPTLSDRNESFFPKVSRQLVKEGEDLFHYRLKTKDRRFDSLLIRFLHNEHVREELIKLGQRFYL